MKVDIVDNALPAAASENVDDTKPMSSEVLAYLVERGDLWEESSLRKLVSEVLTESAWVDVKGYTRPEFFFDDRERIESGEAGVVLLDWDTGMDGSEAVRRTLQARPKDGIFIVTGYDYSSRITQEVSQNFSDSADRIALFRKGEGSVSFLRMVGKFYEMVEAGIIILGRKDRELEEKEEAAEKGQLSRVWYCTNRRPDSEDPLTFGAKREASLRYGRAYVRVLPRTPIKSDWKLWRRFHVASKRTIFTFIDPLPKDDFYALLSRQMAKLEVDDQHFLLFVHGFHVSFTDALESVAQIGYDIRFPGQLGAFSWPSQAQQSKNAYMADKEASINSVDALSNFLTELCGEKTLSRIHVVAHSMGNFLLLQALDRLLAGNGGKLPRQLGEVVLIAADVERDWFLQHKFSPAANRITVYSSNQDWALELAKEYQQVSRLGLMPPVTCADDFDTVDSSMCKTPFKGVGHDYYAESTRLLGDFTLVLQGHPVSKRPAVKEHVVEEGRYWTLESMT